MHNQIDYRNSKILKATNSEHHIFVGKKKASVGCMQGVEIPSRFIILSFAFIQPDLGFTNNQIIKNQEILPPTYYTNIALPIRYLPS